MSRAPKIHSFVDLLNRPVYNSILKLLREEKHPMSSKEMKDRLFPLQSYVLDFYSIIDGKPKKIDKKYYKTMNDTTFNTYLKYLEMYGLLKRSQEQKKYLLMKVRRTKQIVLYQDLTLKEWFELNKKTPMKSFKEIKDQSPENYNKFLSNLVRNSDELEKMNQDGGIVPPYTTKQYII